MMKQTMIILILKKYSGMKTGRKKYEKSGWHRWTSASKSYILYSLGQVQLEVWLCLQIRIKCMSCLSSDLAGIQSLPGSFFPGLDTAIKLPDLHENDTFQYRVTKICTEPH